MKRVGWIVAGALCWTLLMGWFVLSDVPVLCVGATTGDKPGEAEARCQQFLDDYNIRRAGPLLVVWVGGLVVAGALAKDAMRRSRRTLGSA